MTEPTNLGAILRAAREAAGLSLLQMSKVANFSKPYLGLVETGRRDVTDSVARGYDNALGTGGVFAGLLGEDDEMRRRTVLGALGTVAGLGPEAFHEALRVGLMSQFGVEDWPAVAEEHGRGFMVTAPTLFRSQVAADLVMLRQTMARDDTPVVRAAAVRLMTLHGMATANLGDTANAATWYRSARVAADRTQDPQLQQWVRGREVFRRGYEGATPDEVLTLAREVDDVEAHLACAQAHARLGQVRPALAALTAARRAQAAGDQSETTIYAMPGWRMALSSAMVHALLGDVDACDRELADMLPPPSVRRWEAQLQMQRAVAMARAGDLTESRVEADKVMQDLPGEQRSVVLVNMYREARGAGRGRKGGGVGGR